MSTALVARSRSAGGRRRGRSSRRLAAGARTAVTESDVLSAPRPPPAWPGDLSRRHGGNPCRSGRRASAERRRLSRSRDQIYFRPLHPRRGNGRAGQGLRARHQGRLGKRGGRCATSETELELEYTPNDYLQIEFGPRVAYYGIHNVPGLGDRNMGGITGFAVDVRSLIVQRKHSPFAVALSVEPEFHNRDETGGERVPSYSVETKLEADAELIKKRLFLAFNLLYQPEATRAAVGGWDKESTLGVSSVLAFQIVPNVVVGVDLWYLRHYQGGAFNSFTGKPSIRAQRSSGRSLQGAHERRLGSSGRRPRNRHRRRARLDGFFPPAGDIADRIRIPRPADEARGPGG